MSILDQFRLDGQVAVVTGSGQGIGRAIAWALADAGCDVAVNARRSDDLEITAGGIRDRGRRALVAAGDIRDFSETLADRAVAELGGIDVWVNNVGGSDDKDVHLLVDTARRRRSGRRLELNLVVGVPGLQGRRAAHARGGAIVNITSGAGTRGRRTPVRTRRRRPASSTSRRPWRWNSPSAASGSTPCRQDRSPPRRSARCSVSRTGSTTSRRTIPLGRLGTPDDIAAMVLFLCSPGGVVDHRRASPRRRRPNATQLPIPYPKQPRRPMMSKDEQRCAKMTSSIPTRTCRSFHLDDDRETHLLDTQTECTFMWTTKDGDPVGVIMNFVSHDGRFWITCTRRRKRVAAVEARPRVAIAITSRGTDIGVSQSITYKGDAIVHEER